MQSKPSTQDEFIVHLLNLAPHEVVQAPHDHRFSLKNRPKTEPEHLQALQRQGLSQTVSILRGYRECKAARKEGFYVSLESPPAADPARR